MFETVDSDGFAGEAVVGFAGGAVSVGGYEFHAVFADAGGVLFEDQVMMGLVALLVVILTGLNR